MTAPLYIFSYGANPEFPLIQATNGQLYGTTNDGGSGACPLRCGTVFEMAPKGALTTVLSFGITSGDTGAYPDGLVQATDGYLYGTDYYGGANGYGVIFKMTLGGGLTTLYDFCPPGGPSYCPGGAYTDGALVQHTNGTLYGATYGGGIAGTCTGAGAEGCGTIFSMSVGLGPFVKTLPTSGKVGADVTILGTGLSGATSVTFHGTASSFTVNATGTSISTTVPAGATTGPVQVVTPGGTLSSNVTFRVP
ncbi:MAG: choice-of-anchor tandem repeat GloVer-containing protein [Bryobacteraceae bacterium]